MTGSEPSGSVQVDGAGGDGAQTSQEVCSKSLPRGMSSGPRVCLDFHRVDAVTRSFASCTLIGYFLGRPPPEQVLKQWMRDVWEVHGWKVTSVRYLSKGFYAFCFSDPEAAEQVLLRGPWTCRRNLVVLNRWTTDFSVDDTVSFACPVWVEFPGLPLPLGEMLGDIVAPLGRFVCNEPQRLYNPRPHKRACVQVDLSKDLPKEIIINLGNGREFCQPVRYLNLPNTCFRCQSAEHMIRDCPLMPKMTPKPPVQATKAPPARTEELRKEGEGWQTVKGKGKKAPAAVPPRDRESGSPPSSPTPMQVAERHNAAQIEVPKTRHRSPSPPATVRGRPSSPSNKGNEKTLEHFFTRKKFKDNAFVAENPYQALESLDEGDGREMEYELPPGGQ